MNIVIAGNYSQYRWWLNHNQLPPREYRYASHPSNLMGYRCPVYMVGEYWKNNLSGIDAWDEVLRVCGGSPIYSSE